MGRKYNQLAVWLRILKCHLVPQGIAPSLQTASIELHRYHDELLQRNVHFVSYAVDLCKSSSLVAGAHASRAQRLHRAAATERHDAFKGLEFSIFEAKQLSIGSECIAASDFTWPPCTSSVIECSALLCSIGLLLPSLSPRVLPLRGTQQSQNLCPLRAPLLLRSSRAMTFIPLQRLHCLSLCFFFLVIHQ